MLLLLLVAMAVFVSGDDGRVYIHCCRVGGGSGVARVAVAMINRDVVFFAILIPLLLIVMVVDVRVIEVAVMNMGQYHLIIAITTKI